MSVERVTHFETYPFEIGQKIHIKNGPRKGDWEVIGITDKTIKLKCPVSFREFEWKRFCYFAEEKSGVEWPKQH
jgi:hypothetical protein